MVKYVAEIPVRLGSKRVPKKNLRLILGKPMVGYAVDACKGSKFIEQVYINSEADIIEKLCAEYEVNFYRRTPELAEDHIVQDQFNYDFLSNIETENLVMVNPVSPLVTSEDIDKAIVFYEENNLDCLISIREEKLQAFFDHKPLNFSDQALLPMTQSLKPVQLCAWTVCIWNTKKFKEQFEKHGYAVFVGKYGLYPIDPVRSIKVSTEEDFQLAELYLSLQKGRTEQIIGYYE